MAVRFVLYYWPIPFRAQAARYIMTAGGLRWEEPEVDEVEALYGSEIADQPWPFIGPPLLYDREADLWLSQSAAICSYLGEIAGLMPESAAARAQTHKVLGDCTDVLQALTRDCGAQMWSDDDWSAFADARLTSWLTVFEDLGRRHGLTAEQGTLLGAPRPGVADFACAALWVTIGDKLPALEPMLSRHAPNIMALSNRLAATPELVGLRRAQTERWGDLWCAGEIETSLRSALINWRSRFP